jgi:hypothetical protein
MSGSDYSNDEIARRRDAVIRRMANTPPQPHVKNPAHPSKKKKKAALGRAAGKGRAVREG